MTATAKDEIVKLNTLEAWKFVNRGGSGMTMAHPMHVLHGLQFQVIDRQVEAPFRDAWDSVSAGFVDGKLEGRNFGYARRARKIPVEV